MCFQETLRSILLHEYKVHGSPCPSLCTLPIAMLKPDHAGNHKSSIDEVVIAESLRLMCVVKSLMR